MSTTKTAKRRPLLRALAYVAAVAAVGVGIYELLYWLSHVYEPNATVEADFTVLSSSVNGNVVTIHVREGQLVEAQTKLASMDTHVAELDVKSLEADLEKERAARRRVEAELGYFRTELEDRIRTARASITLLNRQHGTLAERLGIARNNLARTHKLRRQSMVAEQRIDDANDKVLEITGALRDLETTTKLKEQEINELEGQRQREAIFQSRLGVIDRNIDKTFILLQQSRQRLRDMHIYSPITGVVNEIYVKPGAYLEDGDRVFLLHDPTRMWIEANVDETEIRHVAVGQSVIVEFDAYPFEDFIGRVRSIGKVTTGMMGSSPNGRESSRSEQKIPVIIDLPEMEKTVWPGMRAAVNIVIW